MKEAEYAYRLMSADEVVDVCRFVNSVFDCSVAPLYTEKGRRNFKEYADPGPMVSRVRSNHFVLVAVEEGRNAEMTGVIEVRDHCHVSLFFVDPDRQGKGLGGELLQRSLEICRSVKPDLNELTVNSSPNAVEIYERMGFEIFRKEQNINGVRSTPMRLRL